MTVFSAEDSDALVPLERSVLRLWRIRVALIVVPVTVLLAGAAAITAVAGEAGAAAVIVVATVVIATALAGLAWWWTGLVWRNWQFRIGAEALHIRHGVLTHHASTIPYHRVQHIDLEAGPIERRLGLTTLVLRTASASSDSTVPGIGAVRAEDLRREILALVGTGDAV